jgi:hypothetical protein
VDIDGKVSQVLTSTAANTEVLQELKSLLCTYMGKFKTTEEGSPSVTKAPIDIEVPISFSAVIPDQTKRTEAETNCSVEDCLEFRDTDQGLCVSNERDTHDVPEEEMPDQTETTKVGSHARERSSVPDIGAAGVEAVPELAPQLPIEVSGDETLPLPSVREEKRTVSAKEKLPQKRGGHGGASGSSKKGVDRQCQKDNGADTGSNPYSMERAVEGLIEGNIVRPEAAPTVAEHSPRKRKKHPCFLQR